MINEPPPFKGLTIRIPIIIPIQGRGFINQGSTKNSSGFSQAARSKSRVDVAILGGAYS